MVGAYSLKLNRIYIPCIPDTCFNPLTAGVFIFYLHIEYHLLNMLKNKMRHQSAIFENSLPPFWQI